MTDPILWIDGLRKEYPNGVTAVDGVSLSVKAGEVVGFLGPNGAGKTTTIKACLGTVTPTEGTVRVAGIDPRERPRKAFEHASAVLEGARNVYWRLTVRENLRFFTGLQGIHPDAAADRHDRLLELVDLESKADEVVRNLSRGMQQKVSLACALARDTPLLFLDEPTLGLDVEASRRLRDEIARLATDEDRAIVLCSHDMDVVRAVCDRVVIMNDGRVVVNDEVEALIDLFRTSTYRLVLAQTGDAQGELDGFDATWDDEVLEVTLTEERAIFELMERLDDAGAIIESIESVEPDLEQVFLDVIDGSSGIDRKEAPA